MWDPGGCEHVTNLTGKDSEAIPFGPERAAREACWKRMFREARIASGRRLGIFEGHGFWHRDLQELRNPLRHDGIAIHHFDPSGGPRSDRERAVEWRRTTQSDLGRVADQSGYEAAHVTPVA